MITPNDLNQLNTRLGEWHAALTSIGVTLFDLNNSNTFQRLSEAKTAENNDLRLRLTGITRQRILPALQLIEEVEKDFGQLSKIEKEATAKAKQLKAFFTPEAKLKEVTTLLDSSSWTQLPTKLNQIQSIIKAIDEAWQLLPTLLSDTEAKLNELNTLAGDLNVSKPSDLDTAAQKLKWSRPLMECDPLGALESMKIINSLVSQAEARLRKQEEEKVSVKRSLEAAHQRVEEILSMSDDIDRALAKCQAELAETTDYVPALRPNSKAIVQLTDWLKRLEGYLQTGDWQPARVGLKEWTKQADACAKHQKKSLQSTNGKLEQLQLIRSYYPALKSSVCAGKLAKDAVLNQLSTQIEKRLFVTPCAVDELSILMDRYEETVKQRRSSNNTGVIQHE